MKFEVVSEYKLSGDQPKAVEALAGGVNAGARFQTLLGVTGSGKTFSVANVIERTQKPTLVLAHNKTLAAQLCSEFKALFPNNAVEYFVSYYDYYQPEAYIPHSDTYIEKDAKINEEIDKLRHSATAALFERSDVIIVASVSCIYGLGDPIDYNSLVISLRPGMTKDRDEVVDKLVEIQYQRNDVNFTRNKFRVRGDTVEVFPSYSADKALRIEFFGDEVERITEINVLTGEIVGIREHCAIYPASHYVTTKQKMEIAIKAIEAELELRLNQLKEANKFAEHQRLSQRTKYDIEMMREMGFCQGIENYSRHISGRIEGSSPFTLIDYFPKDFLLIVDESHVTISQVRAMYAGDRARKKNLIEYGFRLPSALDNRPLNFEEFYSKINQCIFVSATPAEFERNESQYVVEQVIRPTGLVDPAVTVKPIQGQMDDLYSEIQKCIKNNEKVLITTLTKRMAERLTEYFEDMKIKIRYLHSDVKTLERMEIIRDLRIGVFDVIVGINLLREGLDIPEVSLVAILDADKEGFLRSETSMIQTIGRAARNVNGRVIMYADKITKSMKKAIDETERRRKIQQQFNKANNVIPTTVTKSVHALIELTHPIKNEHFGTGTQNALDFPGKIAELNLAMKKAAELLQFELAAQLRDEINRLEKMAARIK